MRSRAKLVQCDDNRLALRGSKTKRGEKKKISYWDKFVKANYEQVKQNNTFGDTMKVLGERWRAMTPEQRAQYGAPLTYVPSPKRVPGQAGASGQRKPTPYINWYSQNQPAIINALIERGIAYEGRGAAANRGKIAGELWGQMTEAEKDKYRL